MFGYRCLVVVVWLAALPAIGVSQSRPTPPEPSLGDLDRELSAEPAFRNPQGVLSDVMRRRGETSPPLPALRPEVLGRKGAKGRGGAGGLTSVATASGTWRGPWKNTRGDSGTGTIIIREEAGGLIAGEEDGSPFTTAHRTDKIESMLLRQANQTQPKCQSLLFVCRRILILTR